MGKGYGMKCSSCDYGISVTEGVGMMYSPNAVFYGRCDDPTQNWSIAFPDGYCEKNKPMLLSLVKCDKIKEKAFELLANGATPDFGYGHELYACPKCMRLDINFYFKLVSPTEQFEPAYQCSNCDTTLRRVQTKICLDGSRGMVFKNNRKINWKCPECSGNKLMDDGNVIMWD